MGTPLPGDIFDIHQDQRLHTITITNNLGEHVIITEEQAMRDPIFGRIRRRMMMYPQQRSQDEEVFIEWFESKKVRPLPKCDNHVICNECNKCHNCQPQDGSWTGGNVCPTCELDLEICACDTQPSVHEVPKDDPATRAQIQQAEAEFDMLISQASSPSLAALVKRAIKTGAIEAKANYTN